MKEEQHVVEPSSSKRRKNISTIWRKQEASHGKWKNTDSRANEKLCLLQEIIAHITDLIKK